MTKNYSNLLLLVTVLFLPLLVAFFAFEAYQWDFSVPFVYYRNDDIWQLIMTKTLIDNSWVLNNEFLGAPGFANGYYNSAAQTSSLHSILMKFISFFVNDPVRVQNYYYFLNFSLISFTSYISCRFIGVSKLFAVAVGLLFAFNIGRLNAPYFAFISNHFMIPLAVVVVIWCAKGEFIREPTKNIYLLFKSILKNKKFILSILIVLFMAISDGYFAFFTVLLLGFSSLVVLFFKKNHRVLNSLIPLVFSSIILVIVLIMMFPLDQYRKTHIEEFYPGGVQDPALTIHPFEAEVYASSLKFMLTPNLNHRIEWVANLGNKLRETGAEARKHGYLMMAQLGTAASISFIFLLSIFLYPKWILDSKFINVNNQARRNEKETGLVLYILALLAAFIFITSSMGGLGSIIALVYPAIRAYNRFPFFLIFTGLLAASYLLTYLLSEKNIRSYKTLIATVIVTILFLLDQVPVNLARSKDLPHVKRFVAERDFIYEIERYHEKGDMIYQYPYAQYMANSSYYGMGSQAQMRSYLHSKNIRWSNGASKNSPMDIWHKNLSSFEKKELFTTLAVYGFKGVVIDRWVVDDDEYKMLTKTAQLNEQTNILENDAAKMAYFNLPDYGFHLAFEPTFRLPNRIHLHKERKINFKYLPSYIQSDKLKRIISAEKGKNIIYFNEHPELFDIELYNLSFLGLNEKIKKENILGDVSCQIVGQVEKSDSFIDLKISNNSTIPWRLNSGMLPITLGYHIKDSNGNIVQWDNGYRYRQKEFIHPNESINISLKYKDLNINVNKVPHILVFELLQEHHAWFSLNASNKVCEIKM